LKAQIEETREKLLARIAAIPPELARDGESYDLLKKRLEADFHEVFERKKEPSPN
jgi:hypothetical protein